MTWNKWERECYLEILWCLGQDYLQIRTNIHVLKTKKKRELKEQCDSAEHKSYTWQLDSMP
jgi:hypothetical protein